MTSMKSVLLFHNILESMDSKERAWQEEEENIYGSRRVPIPAPHFVVFYNGRSPHPERQVMRLSDAFRMQENGPQLELQVLILNINEGYNAELKKQCRTLDEYMQYVDRVRGYAVYMSKDIHVLETAVDRAVDECISEGILRDFLLANKAEVKRRSIYEYDEEAICIRMFHMDKKNFMLRLFIILFTISVSTTIIPCGIVNIHGLFGELKSSAVTEESRPLIEETEKQIFAKENRVKGTNIFNAGLYIVIIILCLIFRLYTKSLPPENTIVTFKVRMNN